MSMLTNLPRSVVLKGILLLALVMGLAGCAKRGGQSGNSDQQLGAEDSMRFYGANLTPEEERALLGKNVYYFGYDRYDVSEQDITAINAHAKKLVTNPHAKVRVEGHTDERGSREYNVALGERRSKAIANVLMLKGVNQNQVDIVSYGKEKPVAFGHDESAWSQNRRGVISYEAE